MMSQKSNIPAIARRLMEAVGCRRCMRVAWIIGNVLDEHPTAVVTAALVRQVWQCAALTTVTVTSAVVVAAQDIAELAVEVLGFFCSL